MSLFIGLVNIYVNSKYNYQFLIKLYEQYRLTVIIYKSII